MTNGKEAPSTPPFIAILRERIEMRRRAKMENQPEPEMHQDPFDLPRPGQHESPENVMMTPPSVGAPLGSSAASSIGMGGTPVHDTSDMDWSYLVSNFQPGMSFGGGFNPFQNFGPFGPGQGMNRMGGMGGPGSGPGGMY